MNVAESLDKRVIPFDPSEQVPAAPLESIVCTQKLRDRPSREPDYQKENVTLLALASALATSPRTILQMLADKALEALRADSAGLSLLTGDKKRFYWASVAGAWSPLVGTQFPRAFGPCGDVLDHNHSTLFTHWEQRYPYLNWAMPLDGEGLLVPIHISGEAVGTIVVAHDEHHRFDAEDIRFLESLSRFASAAYQAVRSIQDLKLEVVGPGDAETADPKPADRLEAQLEARTHELGRNTEDLLESNKALVKDIAEREKTEEALRLSERQLGLIVNTIPALVWSARPDGYAEFFNQHYLNYVGLSSDQLQGTGWSVAVHPDDLSSLAATWQSIMASGKPGEAEGRLRRFDGEYRWFLFRANPMLDEAGSIIKWFGINTDIDDRRRVEAELRRAYESFAAAQRLSRTGNFTADIVADEHIWSAELYRIFEIDPVTTIKLQIVHDLIHPEDVPEFNARFARSLGGADFDQVFRIVTPSRKVKHVHAVGHVIERVAGRPLFIGAIQDVTESKLGEQALNRARAELAHVSRVTTLNALTASIAHEVNQPLSGIVTNASTCLRMLDGHPPNIEGARETARRTLRDGNRATDVIKRLRALFSKKEFTLEPMNLNEATQEVIALSAGDLQRNRVSLRSELADDLPLVKGDRTQLQQVILNLLRNASDAMNAVDDRPRELAIRTERLDGDLARLSVKDVGVGLTPEISTKLFEAFYTTKTDGMGIGLSVSLSIIEAHHGRLWATANDGPGATFSFAIPCGPEASVDSASRDEGIDPATNAA